MILIKAPGGGRIAASKDGHKNWSQTRATELKGHPGGKPYGVLLARAEEVSECEIA